MNLHIKQLQNNDNSKKGVYTKNKKIDRHVTRYLPQQH